MNRYDQTVGLTRATVDRMNGSQPGDPDKAAAAILEALDSPEPPLRLALGADAVDIIGATLDSRRAELDRWSTLSLSAGRRTDKPADRCSTSPALPSRRASLQSFR